MASNLNKAFMRAYAKDRAATADDVPAAPTPTPTHTTVPVPVATRIGPVAQPSMEPTVFAGRYTPPKAVKPEVPTQPAATQPAPMQPAPMQPVPAAMQSQAKQQPSTQPAVVRVASARPPATQAPATQAPATQAPAVAVDSQRPIGQPTPTANTHRIPAPSIQASQKTPAPRVVTAATRPTAQPPVTRFETVQESDTGEASRVWQRIDAAHDAQASHPTSTQARPTVSVSATRTAAPKRMQTAAAAPAPVAPPAPASPLRVEAPSPPTARQLPLVGDETSTNDAQPAESRRRTVADFLYAAGQYNPGRVLASAEHVDVALAPAATAVSAMPVRTSDMVRPMDQMNHVADASIAGHAMSANMQANMTDSSPATMPTHTYNSPAIEEPLPRRMGQILRVDVPRGQSAAAMPAAPMPAAAPTVMPTQAMPTQAMPTQAMPTQAMASQTMPVAPSSMPANASSLDAPVAKYVLEQRRMDRAHQLNEAEDKLRRSTHKVFNPVWEVDNLQWPVVVDKLMQQRAQSMSHVAEHMKTACQDGLSVLGVTSASQAEGRTTVACCLARLAAAHGLNVALVDIDLDHPTLCVQTNMEVEHDWRDCLSEDVSLEEVAVHSIDDQLTVLPLKPRGGRPGLLASDSRIADILADLSECFELVIVDCSKTSSSGNVITGLAHTKIFDAAIVVVDRRDSEADRVEDAVRMIQQTGIESIGIVDNFSM